jgi:hypothetical protein
MATTTTIVTICDHCKVDRAIVDFNYGDINATLKVKTSVPYGYMGEGFVDKIWLCPTCTEQFLAWLYNR